ncbi:MAG TPA: L-threonylcarbamoyladenylate synthase [Chitinophagales bacterium]|jgi:tRNA threonylcarbamoyl adenosine modification protein (Sua5/YciO/YrdC/YwlC family)|nr:threonylcarbamoyl-AMP synthase [Chitinophagales bacterium]HQV78503.1 L-threonylcarbamoyladenylate synthase [Chitinophagales bacterium]HQW78811.1 L-threonylcarbamoyladenylate synthase [Chitinophagales bacterium]HRB68396.1 L-threonylcarbamoyladenylate synthase [Chitinophagales bacterium]
MLIKLFPENIDMRKMQQIVDCLRNGGIIIYPTDTVYGLGCDIFNKEAVAKLCRLKNVKIEKMNFSFICNNLSHISDYTLSVDTPTYKLMKRCLPGPFTFILKANNSVPKLFKNNKKTVGIRVPDNEIARMIVRELGHPIITTSLHDNEDHLEYITEPASIHERYEKLVDIVIDGGTGGYHLSTVIDCSGEEPIIIREGIGKIDD